MWDAVCHSWEFFLHSLSSSIGAGMNAITTNFALKMATFPFIGIVFVCIVNIVIDPSLELATNADKCIKNV